jgi:transcriptional regulator with XRE-family HTH domain
MTPENKKSIAVMVRQRIDASGKSQNQFAQALGISPAQLSNVLNDDKHDSVSDLFFTRIAAACSDGRVPTLDLPNFANLQLKAAISRIIDPNSTDL